MIKVFSDIDKLTSGDFEFFVRDVFLAAGWTNAIVTEVGKEYKHGDGGVDIFAYKNRRKFAIEVKQRNISTTVDVKSLNQLVTGAKLANAMHMILVTNSYFTSEVMVRALRLGVELIDRDQLQNLWRVRHSEIGRDIKPRKYQTEVISGCIDSYRSGKTKMLIEMATGLGKTYTVGLLVKKIFSESRTKLRVLFIAHQIEILLQSVTSFKNVFGIGNYSFSACFSGSSPEKTDFVFASFDTLYGQIQGLADNSFDIVIVDEAHHTPARTYSQVINYFKPKLLLGLTATPFRVDNRDVLDYFGGPDSHIGKFDLAWALRHNKLAFPKYMVMLDDLDQTRINQLETGMSITDLDRRLFLHKKDEEVVKIIETTVTEKNIKSPKGIVFCRSIEHMKYLIQFFQIGTATMVHSKMTAYERRENIRKFRESDFSFILVCDLFNEGIDIPETNILIFMRYTGSKTIWLQQLGRGLRKTKVKDYVYVLDFVGSLERIYEVKELQERIKKIDVDSDNKDAAQIASVDGTVHDSTLNVTYNQSAAQVLKLIEQLKYRLNSRELMLDRLRVYFGDSGKIPGIGEVEYLFDDVTCDQISTHFDSYFGYIKVALPGKYDEKLLLGKINAFAGEYVSRYHISPSIRAISMEFKYKSLMEFTERDIKQLGYTEPSNPKVTISDNVQNNNPEGKSNLDKTVFSECEENISSDIDRLTIHQRKLLKQYADLVKTLGDVKALPDHAISEIMNHFNSLFYFLQCINDSR